MIDETEREIIDAWIVEHGVTRLPAQYAVRVSYALPEVEQDRRLKALELRVLMARRAFLGQRYQI